MKLLALATALCLATPALAQEPIRPQEADRLARYHQTAGDALLQAMAAGAPQDVAALASALAGTPLVAFDESLVGLWNCRTMKLGGLSALVVYTDFQCRIGLDASGAVFEKLSGSQRTSGRIGMRDGRAIYLGVGYVAGATAVPYADLPADFGGDGTLQPQVAVFERISASRARLLFPAPVVESNFDILELTR